MKMTKVRSSKMIQGSVCFLHVAIVLNTVLGELQQAPLENLCPFHELCNERTNPPLRLPFFVKDKKSCCLSCSCQSDCETFGSCCPTVVDRKPNSVPLECLLPVANPDTHLIQDEMKRYYGPIQRYKVISSCPESEFDIDKVMACDKLENEFPEDIIIVSDDKGRLFKNKFCAVCHNVTNYSTWTMHIRGCSIETLAQYRSNIPFRNFSDCMFWSEPVNKEAFVTNRCFTSIDSCNFTGLATNVDSFTKDMCSSMDIPYMQIEADGRYRVFKNPYCNLCNAAEPRLQLLCNFQGQDNMYTGMEAVFADHSHLTALNGSSSPCAESMVFNPLSKTCSKLNCPPFSSPVYGFCKEIFVNVTNVIVDVAYRVEGLVPVNQDGDTIIEMRDSILNTIEQRIQIPQLDCFVSSKIAYARHVDKEFTLILVVKYITSGKCVLNYILSLVANVNSRFEHGVQIEANNSSYNLAVSLCFDRSFDSSIEFKYLHMMGNFTANSTLGLNTVLSVNLPTCSRVSFNETELAKLMNKKGRMPQKMKKVKEGGETLFTICLEDIDVMLSKCPKKSSCLWLVLFVIAHGMVKRFSFGLFSLF